MRIANVEWIVRVIQSVILNVPLNLTNASNRAHASLNVLVVVLVIVKMRFASVPIQMRIPTI